MTDKRVLAIDYGDSRTGIAVSDMLGITAQPVETVHHKGDDGKAAERIAVLTQQYKAGGIVYGLPLNMNGTCGPRVEKTILFIQKLKEELEKKGLYDIILTQWDERLTSVMANRAMRDAGVKTKKKKGIVDQMAAVQILQEYLDSRRAVL